jgi:hypothetical protein
MEKRFIKRKLELGYAMELYNYDIYPKVVAADRETKITVAPLGDHAAFTPGQEYELRICPFDEGKPSSFPARPNKFSYKVIPNEQGNSVFRFVFFGEQEYFIRISHKTNEAQDFFVELSLFCIAEDLIGRYPFKGDLHMHTTRSDGRQAPAIVCANYRKTGYDFTVISDHRRYYPSLEAIAAYKDAPIDLNIVTGEEVHLPNDHDTGHANDVHIINFGGDYSINGLVNETDQIRDRGEGAEFRAVIPDPPPVRTKEALYAEVDALAETLHIPDGIEKYPYAECCWTFDQIRKANGLGVFCHPYWISDVLQIPPTFVDYMMETHPFDAFEVLGGELYFEQNGFQTLQYYEDRAKGRIYAIVGATDSHSSINSPGSHLTSTIVFAPENTKTALVDSIRGRYSVAVDTISAEPRYVGELRFVRYAHFLEKNFFPLHDELCFEEGRAMRDYVTNDKEEGLAVLKLLHGRTQAQREKYFAF